MPRRSPEKIGVKATIKKAAESFDSAAALRSTAARAVEGAYADFFEEELLVELLPLPLAEELVLERPLVAFSV